MAKKYADLLAAYQSGKRFGVYTKKGALISYHGTKKSATVKAENTDFEIMDLIEVAMTQLSLLEESNENKPS